MQATGKRAAKAKLRKSGCRQRVHTHDSRTGTASMHARPHLHVWERCLTPEVVVVDGAAGSADRDAHRAVLLSARDAAAVAAGTAAGIRCRSAATGPL